MYLLAYNCIISKNNVVRFEVDGINFCSEFKLLGLDVVEKKKSLASAGIELWPPRLYANLNRF
jgi:hypothetical protein